MQQITKFLRNWNQQVRASRAGERPRGPHGEDLEATVKNVSVISRAPWAFERFKPRSKEMWSELAFKKILLDVATSVYSVILKSL